MLTIRRLLTTLGFFVSNTSMVFNREKRRQAKAVAASLDRLYKESDLGRRYGWWLCLNGKRIADLNYLRWDSDSQFWHEYRLVAFSPDFADVALDPNRWCLEDISLESRYAEGYRTAGILVAPRAEGVVAIRSVHIPRQTFLLAARQSRITLNPSGYSIEKYGEVVAKIFWSDVKEIFAFKRDLFAYDLICLGFRTNDDDTFWEVDEQCIGYRELLKELTAQFPGIRTDWFEQVAHPAFATNRTTLWGKPC